MIHPTIMQNLNPKFLLFCAKKMTKSNMFWRFENDYSYIQFCHFLSFLCSSEYKYLKLIFYTFAGYIIDYMRICFQNFLKLKNMIFDFFKTRLLVPMCTKSLCIRTVFTFQ
jgi:hypothetical protein